ncbi:hypothetical protein [Microbacterium amylolyticum]|uniref:Uncharacterized protein n=1 Tax=Microbacterium amylolyticum TaxID=936337 RepID=A0ABS4ZGY6_9MICO|nr:hypothetical protein [Microbacterium amylolyticum]MBP2436308.1 hypothetical protein [Microbacterium amylolyticum]
MTLRRGKARPVAVAFTMAAAVMASSLLAISPATADDAPQPFLHYPLTETEGTIAHNVVLLDEDQSGNYFIVGLGNEASSNDGDGYLFLTGNTQFRGAATLTNWQGEENARSDRALPRGEW